MQEAESAHRQTQRSAVHAKRGLEDTSVHRASKRHDDGQRSPGVGQSGSFGMSAF